MHMADALLSPSIGITGWLLAAGTLALAARHLSSTNSSPRESESAQHDGLGRSAPTLGVLGAFIFASQMLNFTIPGTGSSGHIGGGLLLAILLGPWSALLIMASVLAVQALFFADGGLLAWGCNLVNLGVFPCFVAYPLVYRPLARLGHERAAAVLAALIGLELGALGVVLETSLSGITALPFLPFLGLMLPIHAAIGLVEGLATAAVLVFLNRVDPALTSKVGQSGRGVVYIGLLALLFAGGLSWFASTRPDGLEWSMARVSGQEVLEAPESSAHRILAQVQERLAFLPDYGFPSAEQSGSPNSPDDAWPSVQASTSTAGLVGGIATLGLIAIAGLTLGRIRRVLAR